MKYPIVIIVFAFARLLMAANAVYIGQSLAGNGDGTSCSNEEPYTYFNSSANWSGTPTGIQIGPDTTVHLCGNITGTGGTNATALVAQGSGTSGHPVTILFESGASMNASSYWSTAININGNSNIIIDGGTPCGTTQGGQLSPNACNGTISNTGNGTQLSTQAYSTFIANNSGSCDNCEIRNLALINDYIHTACYAPSGCDGTAGTTENAAITIVGGSKVKIHDNLVHDCSWCVNFQALTGDGEVDIYNNNIYNAPHGIASYGGVGWPGPLKIYNNAIHDYQNWDTGNLDAYHADGIHVFGGGLAEVDIYNNRFATQNQCCITGEIFLEGGTSFNWTDTGTWNVFNNIFLITGASCAVNGLAQPYHGNVGNFLNNTVSGCNGAANIAFSGSTYSGNFTNNAITSFGYLTVGGGDAPVYFRASGDYNAYANCSSYGCWSTFGVSPTGSFSAYQSGATPNEAHSSYNATSLYLNSDGSPTSSSTNMIGQGTNLTSLCSGNLAALCSDISGNPRPTSGAWDIGAFQYATNPPSLQPFAAGGLALSASGGSGSLNLTLPAGYAWTAVSSASWLTLNGPVSGTGSGTLSYQVAPNAGPDRSATITVAGYTFTIEQEAGSIPGLSFIGSMPHIAAEENWTTTFTLVNKSTASPTARLSLFGDPSGTLTLPLTFPQQAAAPNPLLAASLDRTLGANASLIIDAAGPQTPPVQVGSAQLSSTGAVDGFAIFHLIPGAQEAVVPMETRNASSYLLAFDNTGGVVLGVAVQNVSAQPGVVGVVIRDDTGAQIGTGNIPVSANGHTSFVLSSQYTITANKRGTIEFDTPAGGQISVLGIRTTPLGSTTTLTTIPALANVGTGGGSIAHLASGNGWQTTFVLVNTGTSVAQVQLNFFADVTGTPLSLPLSFPQSGSGDTTVASSINQTLAAGATLLVQSTGALTDPLFTGSAQLNANGNVSGFVIFRYNPTGQEAVVPLESRNANAYVLAFDDTAGTATGIAINSVSSQAVNVPVVIRDDTGAQIGMSSIPLAANGHSAFVLSTQFPATANIRGTIEFDTPSGAQIGALGIRTPATLTYTTLPALVK